MLATIHTSEQLTLHPPRQYQFDDEYFFALCQANQDLRLERDANGNLILMPLVGSETGRYNAELTAEVAIWNRQKQRSYVFDSSTGFTLPNSAVRSPDVSWIRKERWDQLPKEKREKFAPICPDFVIEISSMTDSIHELKAKMEEYRENGSRLCWLIDRIEKTVTIYRENGVIETRMGEQVKLSGEAVLEGFEVVVVL